MRTAIECPSEKASLLLCDVPLLDQALLPCSFGRVGYLLGRVPVTYAVSSWAESRNHVYTFARSGQKFVLSSSKDPMGKNVCKKTVRLILLIEIPFKMRHTSHLSVCL